MSEQLSRWDGKLPQSILSDYDLRVIAYSISSALHYCTGIASCRIKNPSDLCAMCGNAMRLVIQNAERRILDAALERTARALGRTHIDLDPPTADDTAA